MSSALETLGSQLNGAKEYRQVGVSLWKCIIILGFMLPFIGTIWYYTGDIFKAIGRSVRLNFSNNEDILLGASYNPFYRY
jgi:Na+-driven multidrug efflux pump